MNKLHLSAFLCFLMINTVENDLAITIENSNLLQEFMRPLRVKFWKTLKMCKNHIFSVGFRTTPMDNTGVSHILEHTTLCGSEKFPCRDPFFSMLTRSLSTYMNAWTG